MKKAKRILLVVSLCLLVISSGASAEVTIEEIMEMVDHNTYYNQAYFSAEMVIRSGRREMTKEMISYVRDNDAFVEFTNRADRGTKYLKLEDELWMFFPDAEDLVKISGHMLQQGFMGSDVSYEDMLQSDKLTELYHFELVGEESVDGKTAWVIEANAKDGVEVSYAKRKMWIDQDTKLAVREELYALSGRLLKETWIEEIKEIDDRFYPMVIVMEDSIRQNTSTTVRMKEIDFNREIPDELFSLQNLMR